MTHTSAFVELLEKYGASPSLLRRVRASMRKDESMEIEASVSFSRQELWTLLESLPESNKELAGKLSEALAGIERKLPVYGGITSIRPKGSK
jgi:hypothetical protein